MASIYMYTVLSYGSDSLLLLIFRLNPLEQGRSSYVAYMGSPVILLEKGADDSETAEAFMGMKTMLASGMMDKVNDDAIQPAGGLEVKKTECPGVNEASGLENVRSLESSAIPLVSIYCI